MKWSTTYRTYSQRSKALLVYIALEGESTTSDNVQGYFLGRYRIFGTEVPDEDRRGRFLFRGRRHSPPPEISQNWGPRKWDLRRSNSACYNVSVCFNLGRSTEPLLPKPSLIRSRLQFTLKNPKKPGLFVQRVLFSNVRIPVFILSRQNRFPQHTRFTFFVSVLFQVSG